MFYNQGGYQGAQQNQTNFPKKTELFTVLQTCSHNNTNAVAQDASNVLFNYQNQFNPITYQYNDPVYHMTRSFLELKGDLAIKYKNSNYSIITSLQFPGNYPDAPCIVKIHNPDVNKFKPNNYFIQGAQPDGSVYVSLSENASWNNHRSIGRVLLQLVNELSSHFPFYDKNVQQQAAQPNNQPYYPQQGQPAYQQPTNNYYQPPAAQAPYNYGNQPNYQQPQGQPQQPYTNGNWQQPYGQQPQPARYSGSWDMDQQLKTKCSMVLDPLTIEVVGKIKEEKQYSEKLIGIYCTQELKKQQLSDLSKDIQTRTYTSKTQEVNFAQFVSQNDGIVLNRDTIHNYLQETDPLSTQVIDLVSELQAQKEAFHLIADLFKQGDSDLETVMKVTRQIAETQFNCTLLLQKCMKQ